MNTKTTLILAVVALVVGGYVFWDLVGAEEAKKTEEVAARQLFDPKPAGIDRVQLVSDDGTFTFRKEDNDWRMVEPIDAGANTFEVNAIVDKAADVKWSRAYDKDAKDRPSPAVSGLEKPSATVRLYKGDKLEAELLVGKRLPTGKGTYVARGSDGKVYEAQTDLTSAFDKRLEALRDKRVLKFELKDVRRVKVEGLKTFELAKAGEDWIVEAPGRSRADKDRSERVIRPLTNLNVQEWKDDKPSNLRIYGLDRPRLRVAVETTRQVPAKFKPGDAGATRPADTQPSTEEKTLVLLVGGAADESNYFAKLENSPAVFTLPQYTVNELSPQLSELRDKALTKIDSPSNVTRIEAQIEDGSYALTRSDKDEWTLASGATADGSAVDELLRTIQNMRAADFADPTDPLAQFNWDKPRAKVTLTRKGELAPVTLLVGPNSASGKMVYVRNAAEEVVAVVREEEAAQLLSPPAAYQDRSVMRFQQDRANKIEVTRKEGPKVLLEKAGTQWSLAQPVQAKADADAVRNILQDLSSLRAKRVVDAGKKEKYGLDAPEVQLAVWVQPLTADPNTKVAGQATQPAATQPASTRPASTQPAGKPTLEELLAYQKTLPNANPLATKMLEDLIAKEKAEAATKPAEATTRPSLEEYLKAQKANPNANPKMTEALEKMLAEQGGAATKPATAQAASTRPATTQPAAPTIFRLAIARKDGVTYAAREDQPIVYELDAKVYDDALAELHDRQILKFEPNNVTDVAFESGESRIVLRKTGEEWKYLPDPVVPIDKQKVTDVLNAFRDLRTHRYVDYAADDLSRYGLDKQVDRVAVTADGGKTTGVLVAKTGPQDDPDKSRYAVVDGTKAVFLLKGDQAAKFAQKLEDFEKKAAAPAAANAAPVSFN